jgi:AcrR family transcriptional regulator
MSVPGTEEDLFDEQAGWERVHAAIVRELGSEDAASVARMHVIQESWERERRPNEGLRERKKRITRQQISDVATTLCVSRGFEHVRVSDVAEIVGVSEKTVYNYFPTKEAMVFDLADETVERLAAALRDRDAGESPTSAVARLIREDMERFEQLPKDAHEFFPRFAEMVDATPSLRAAWRDIQARLVEVAAEELAAWAGVDPREPEPIIAAQALVGLQSVVYDSRVRHAEAGLPGAELIAMVRADLDRAVRLLEAGLGSFDLLSQERRSRRQLAEAARAAEEARTQVIAAVKQARIVWNELRREQGIPETAEYRAATRGASESARAAWRSAREVQRAAREAKRASERAQRSRHRERSARREP